MAGCEAVFPKREKKRNRCKEWKPRVRDDSGRESGRCRRIGEGRVKLKRDCERDDGAWQRHRFVWEGTGERVRESQVCMGNKNR